MALAGGTLSATSGARTTGNSTGVQTQTRHPWRPGAAHTRLPGCKAHPQARLLGHTRSVPSETSENSTGPLCQPPPTLGTRCYSNLQLSPSLAPHPPGRGAKAVAQLVLCRVPGAQGTPEPLQQDPHYPDNLTRPRCSELRPVPGPQALPWKIRAPGSHRPKPLAVTWWSGRRKRGTLCGLHTWEHGWQWVHT